MYSKRLSKIGFVLLVIVTMSLVTTATTATAAATPIAVSQEAALVGGLNGCEFGAGLSVGLGLAGLGGCVFCAGASLLIDVGLLFACT